jgi:hypothetical protein
MHKLILAVSFVALFAIVGCSAGPSAATPAPSVIPSIPAATPEASPSAAPSQAGVPTPAPATPAPTAKPTPKPTATPKPRPSAAPTPVAFSRDEAYLFAGVRSGVIDCEPVRSALPPRATAGIECGADTRVVARVGFYLFDDESDLLAAYFARMKAEGVKIESGETCRQGEAERGYFPGDGELVPNRGGCFINGAGIANYRATIPARIYIGILGRNADMAALEDWAWIGQQDTPGGPTLWAEPGS